MKQKLVVYLAGLLTVVGLGFGQAQFSDVPAGHWAKEAVDRITSCGLIIGFPDGTFRGNQNLTRYQAALIFQRLLTELEKGGQCVNGGQLSSDDLTTIRNGVQELAAELAALGVRVSALEDNAASKDDVAQLQAAIDELKGMQGGQSGMSEDALKDLADRVEAASVAADTALAQSQILGERLDTVEGDVAALKTQVDADGDSIKALNELAVLLNQDVLSLQDRVTALESTVGNVDLNSFATKEDVNAVQEFATALRGDLVALTDKVNGIDARVQKLEAVTFSLTGDLSATYGYWLIGNPQTGGAGTNFDIDRLFPNNILSSGDGSRSGRFRNKYRRIDTDQNYSGAGINLNFGLKYANVGATGITDVSVGTSATLADAGVDLDRSIKVNSATINGKLDNQAFSIVYTNDDSTFRFNPYLFSNKGGGDAVTLRGVVATLNATNWLLSPKFTVVSGTGSTDATNGGGSTIFNGDYFGVRAELNLLGLTTGLSYAENKGNRSAFGLDWNGSLFNFLNLEGAYVASKLFANTFDFSNQLTTDQAFYIKGGVSLGILSVTGNYRAIDPDFENGVAGMSDDQAYEFFGVASGLQDAAPFAADNRGFGVEGTLKLGILSGIEVRGYFDSSTDFNGLNPQQGFGVGAKIGLFAGFGLTGYFNSAQENGAAINALDGRGAYGNTGAGSGYNSDDYNSYTSGFGVRLKHDGKADNALIKGLNLLFGYDSYNGDASVSDLQFGANYSLNLGFLTLNPAFRYHNFMGNSTAGDKYEGYSTIKFGITASTQPLGIFLKPGLEGAFGYRNTNYAASAATNETYYRVGLSFNEFLASGSVFKVGYASYTATNVKEPGNGAQPFAGYGNSLTSYTNDRMFAHPSELFSGQPFGTGSSTATTSGGASGLYVEWQYGNLQAGAFFGGILDANGNAVSQGSGFKVTYDVKF
jgi:hypothetical protein